MCNIIKNICYYTKLVSPLPKMMVLLYTCVLIWASCIFCMQLLNLWKYSNGTDCEIIQNLFDVWNINPYKGIIHIKVYCYLFFVRISWTRFRLSWRLLNNILNTNVYYIIRYKVIVWKCLQNVVYVYLEALQFCISKYVFIVFNTSFYSFRVFSLCCIH